ncbi:MAG: hypothetical protein U0X20_02035 [Caldilineaceae bacterium]
MRPKWKRKPAATRPGRDEGADGFEFEHLHIFDAEGGFDELEGIDGPAQAMKAKDAHAGSFIGYRPVGEEQPGLGYGIAHGHLDQPDIFGAALGALRLRLRGRATRRGTAARSTVTAWRLARFWPRKQTSNSVSMVASGWA